MVIRGLNWHLVFLSHYYLFSFRFLFFHVFSPHISYFVVNPPTLPPLLTSSLCPVLWGVSSLCSLPLCEVSYVMAVLIGTPVCCWPVLQTSKRALAPSFTLWSWNASAGRWASLSRAPRSPSTPSSSLASLKVAWPRGMALFKSSRTV